MTNYVRRELTRYDCELRAFSDLVGTEDAYVEHKNAILETIVRAYPYLSNTCHH